MLNTFGNVMFLIFFLTRERFFYFYSTLFSSTVFLFQYERDGYLAVKDIFNEDEKKELTEAMDELIEM